MATVIERVRAGATFLDGRVVGWAGQVRVDLLDMFDCFGCVLGQLFAGYTAGCKALGLSSDEGCWSESAALGFHAVISIDRETFFSLSKCEQDVIRLRVYDEYRDLRAAWLSEIALRLGTLDSWISEEARVEALPVASWEDPL